MLYLFIYLTNVDVLKSEPKIVNTEMNNTGGIH